jgi:hypothetical protein
MHDEGPDDFVAEAHDADKLAGHMAEYDAHIAFIDPDAKGASLAKLFIGMGMVIRPGSEDDGIVRDSHDRKCGWCKLRLTGVGVKVHFCSRCGEEFCSKQCFQDAWKDDGDKGHKGNCADGKERLSQLYDLISSYDFDCPLSVAETALKICGGRVHAAKLIIVLLMGESNMYIMGSPAEWCSALNIMYGSRVRVSGLREVEAKLPGHFQALNAEQQQVAKNDSKAEAAAMVPVVDICREILRLLSGPAIGCCMVVRARPVPGMSPPPHSSNRELLVYLHGKIHAQTKVKSDAMFGHSYKNIPAFLALVDELLTNPVDRLMMASNEFGVHDFASIKALHIDLRRMSRSAWILYGRAMRAGSLVQTHARETDEIEPTDDEVVERQRFEEEDTFVYFFGLPPCV